MGAIGVIRSLGMHGYVVHAASSNPAALGCKSTFTAVAHQCPAYGEPNYLPWLRSLIKSANIAAIIPSEGFLLAIREHFAEFSPLMSIPANPDLVYGCLSKVYVFDQFLRSADHRLQDHISRTLVLDDAAQLKDIDFKDWRLPFFVKGDGYYGKHAQDSLVQPVYSVSQVYDAVISAFQRYSKVLLQDCSSGVKATVNLLIQDGQILAESMAVASHENPHRGGLTSLRRSWWHQPMYEDAVLRLQALRWNGPAMVEYKWDESAQKFDFIELNSRYWAALNMDILAGIHFPAIQMNYFLYGIRPQATERLTRRIVVRHAFPADFGYLMSKLKDPNVTLIAKLKSLVGFFIYFLHPGILTDLNFPGDRALVWINTKAFLAELGRACLKKLS